MFAEIDDRREQVQAAHRETFRWIFEDGRETGFAEWLSAGDGVFWVNGKPASGKSTLMKFITRAERMHELLQLWSGSTPLVVAVYWFWIAGSQLQRSLTGLYRTLLYQMLRADERLCRIAFPDWQRRFKSVDPTMEALTSAMHAILETDDMSTNFFFAIDGLDEYDRDSIGKTELAQLFLDMTRSMRVKLLVSSRPEAAFESVFRQCPSIRLENLTKPDIVSYVKSRLWTSPSVKRISNSERFGVDDIEKFIVGHANGVFLWVALVLNVVLDGLNNYEDLWSIRDRIQSLPPELDALFAHIMFQRIPPHFREEAFRYLSIALLWKKYMQEYPEYDENLTDTMVITAERAFGYSRACELSNSDGAEIEAAKSQFPSRLAHRCHGLLECAPGYGTAVTFLHRTLFDYLCEDEGARHVLECGVGDEFDVHTALMAGFILSIPDTYSAPNKSWEPWAGFQITFFRLNHLAEISTGRSRREMVESFGRRLKRCGSDLSNTLVYHSEYLPAPDVYACAIYTGSVLCLEDALRNAIVSDVRALSGLLWFAVWPYLRPLSERDRNNRLQPVNFEAAALLLAYGADPASDWSPPEFDRMWRVWAVVLREIVIRGGVSDDVLEPLRLLMLFVQNAPDLRKCIVTRAMELDMPQSKVPIVQVLRDHVLEGYCCNLKVSVQHCQCEKAQKWRPVALKTLRLIKEFETKIKCVRKPGSNRERGRVIPKVETKDMPAQQRENRQTSIFGCLRPITGLFCCIDWIQIIRNIFRTRHEWRHGDLLVRRHQARQYSAEEFDVFAEQQERHGLMMDFLDRESTSV